MQSHGLDDLKRHTDRSKLTEQQLIETKEELLQVSTKAAALEIQRIAVEG